MALGKQGRLETAPRKREQSRFLEAGALGFLAEEGILSAFLWRLLGCREGSGNPLQYSCLENPMDGEAW